MSYPLSWVIVVMGLCSGVAVCSADAPPDPNVKLSANGICHPRDSVGYGQTRTARPFDSIEACLEAGGHLPKGMRPTAAADHKALFDSDDPTIVKKSRSGLCHDASSGSFEATIHFTAYRTMQDCLDSGGRRPDGER